MNSLSKNQNLLFHLLCLGGLVVTLGLLIREISDPPPIRTSDVKQTVQGDAVVVEGTVRNRSDRPKCPVVVAVVENAGGKTIGEVAARPVSGKDVLEAGAERRYTATLESVPAKERRELGVVRLDVTSAPDC